MRKIGLSFLAVILLLCVSFSLLTGCAADWKYDRSEEHAEDYFYTEDIFHDQAAEFMSPQQPTKDQNVTIRLKVKRGLATEVSIKYSFDLEAGEEAVFYPAPMVFECADDNLNYDYWIGIIPANEAYYRYHFELKNNRETIWFDMNGLSEEAPSNVAGDWYVLPDFKVPEWSQGAVWYSVMPDSFYNGNTLNDKTGTGIGEVWGSSVHSGMTGYFGGDILGLLAQMDYLKGLNITSLFINPIWVTAHNAGYGQYDHFQIDSAYGNDDLFLEFVNALHEDELKIMCDAVIQYVNINHIIYNYTGMYPDLYDGKYDNAVQYDENGMPIDSGWGGPLVDFSKKIARDYFYSSEESVLITYILKYAIDGWRMDVGNDLSGSDPDNWGDSTQILADIRRYIKAAGEDLLFLSEHAVDGQLTEGILDSKWNYAFESAVEDWVSGISNAAILSSSLKAAVLELPRPVANAMYNHLTSHDYQRLYDKIGQDDVKFAAAQLIQFTYVGSPVIYYGEEIGLSRPIDVYADRTNSFDAAMNWDQSTWNHNLYNFTSALAELRAEYENTYRFGAFADLYSEGRDNPHDVFAYARFDSENTCVTLLNQGEETVRGFELDVRLLSLTDGTVLTDYLSGRQYVVQNGRITADIYPGGSVLVTGDDGNYRDEYKVLDLGGSGSVVKEDVGQYTVSGNGSLGAADEIIFAAAKGFNNCEISAELLSVNGSAALMIRDAESKDSPFYGVLISPSSMTLISRSAPGSQYRSGPSLDLTGAKKIRISRTNDNVFRTYVDRGSGWEEAEAFVLELPFDYTVCLGVAPISGELSLALCTEALEEQTGADYEKGLGSLAFVQGEASAVSVADGKLTIAGGEADTFVVTQAHYVDFTQKALISYVPKTEGSFAGLTVMQSEKDYIVAGRYLNGGTVSLIVGQVINGRLCVYGARADLEGEITLQLQRSGMTYTALVSTDGGQTYSKIGTVEANYSRIFAGLVRSGSEALTADYWCFGESVESVSLADHYYAEEIDFSLLTEDTSIAYSIRGGEWEYVQGGIAQTDAAAANAIYSLSTKKVTDFRTTFSLLVTAITEDEQSYVGVVFGRSSVDAVTGSTVRLFADGKVRLIDAEGKTVAEGQTSLTPNELLQFTLIVREGVLALYEGNDPELVLCTDELPAEEGYFGWISNRAAFELYSYNVYVPTGNFFLAAGDAYLQESMISSDYVDLELSSSNSYNYLTMKDLGVSDFAVSFNLQISRINPVYRGYADFAFGVSAGASHLKTGIVIRINDMGRLSVFVDGEQKEDNLVTGLTDTTSCFIVIAYQNGTLSVFYANYKDSGDYTEEDLKLLYGYTDGINRSGSLAFYSQNAGVRYNALRGCGLSDGTDFTSLDLYREILISEPLPGDPEIGTGYGGDYRNDFNGNSDLATILKYSGASTVKDGCLTINGFNPQNWDAGAAIATGIYKNFELTARVKVVEMTTNGGFVGIEFYKSSATVNHQASALTVILYPEGTGHLFLGNGNLSEYQVTGVADAEGFYTVSLRVENGVITFSLGGESTSVAIADLAYNSDLTEGYISLNAGANTGIFDYVEIKVLD